MRTEPLLSGVRTAASGAQPSESDCTVTTPIAQRGRYRTRGVTVRAASWPARPTGGKRPALLFSAPRLQRVAARPGSMTDRQLRLARTAGLQPGGAGLGQYRDRDSRRCERSRRTGGHPGGLRSAGNAYGPWSDQSRAQSDPAAGGGREISRIMAWLRPAAPGLRECNGCGSRSSATPASSSRPATARCCAIRGSRLHISGRGSRSPATTDLDPARFGRPRLPLRVAPAPRPLRSRVPRPARRQGRPGAAARLPGAVPAPGAARASGSGTSSRPATANRSISTGSRSRSSR